MHFAVLFASLIPVLIPLIIALVYNSKDKKTRRSSKTKIVVYHSELYAYILLLCSAIFFAFILMAPLMWGDEAPNPFKNKSDIIFYLVFGAFVLIGVIASIKILKFKLVFQLNKKTITVYPVILKLYSFSVDDISCIKRQTKKRYQMLDAERVVITVKGHRRVIVDSSYVSYRKFVENLIEIVDKSILVGFE